MRGRLAAGRRAIVCPGCGHTLKVTKTEDIELIDHDGTLGYRFRDVNKRNVVKAQCGHCGWTVMGWHEIGAALGLKIAEVRDGAGT